MPRDTFQRYTYTYKKATIFFNYGVSGATAGTKTYYFDDIIFMPATIPNVTFSVNMTQYVGTFDTVYLSGDWNGWSGNSQKLVRQGTSKIWQGTFPVSTGSHEYKFTLDNWNDQEI